MSNKCFKSSFFLTDKYIYRHVMRLLLHICYCINIEKCFCWIIAA